VGWMEEENTGRGALDSGLVGARWGIGHALKSTFLDPDGIFGLGFGFSLILGQKADNFDYRQ